MEVILEEEGASPPRGRQPKRARDPPSNSHSPAPSRQRQRLATPSSAARTGAPGSAARIAGGGGSAARGTSVEKARISAGHTHRRRSTAEWAHRTGQSDPAKVLSHMVEGNETAPTMLISRGEAAKIANEVKAAQQQQQEPADLPTALIASAQKSTKKMATPATESRARLVWDHTRSTPSHAAGKPSGAGKGGKSLQF